MNDKKIDLLAIGDIVTEPFIKITDAEATCDLNKEHCKLSFRFGDKIPYDSAMICKAVGNSPNVAVGAARLGLNSYLISYVGEDDVGKENIEALISNGVKIDFMETVPEMESNYHFVLWYETERTILVKHQEYPYVLPSNLSEPKWIYLSSLAKNSTDYHKQIVNYLNEHKDVKLAFQPGTFQIKMGVTELKDIYNRTDIFFGNKQEYQKVLESQEEDVSVLMKKILSLGPKMAVLTDGPNGAYVYDGKEAWFMKAYPKDPYERTGAGDAFSSTFVSALILEKSIEESLVWAGVNAISVTQHIGTQKGLMTRSDLEEFLTQIPDDYKPQKLN